MIKAIFFDVDGTLLSFKTSSVPSKTIETLHKLKEKGIKLYIATGRGMEGLYVLGDFEFDGYITLNGQCTYDKDKNIIIERFLDEEDVRTLLKEASIHNYACGFSSRKGKVFNMRNELVEDVHRMTGNDNQPVGDMDKLELDKQYMSMTFVNEEEEKELLKKLHNVTSARWYPTFCDIMSYGSSKGKGIESFLEYSNLNKEEVMAFGDGGNDISMFEAVGISVAMGDGEDKLKEIASYITDSIDDDGITNACLHFKLL